MLLVGSAHVSIPAAISLYIQGLVILFNLKGQDNRVEAEEEGELAFAPPPYASSSAIYGQTFCPEVWKEDRFSLLGCPIFTDQAKFA